MIYNSRKYLTIVSLLILTFLINPLPAQIEFSGNLTAVSTYVWRGIKANNGPAIQSDAAVSYDFVTFGLWGSSIDFGGNEETETDFYLDLALPTGELSSSVGVTVYMWDLNSFNAYADAEYEINAKFGLGAFGAGVFFVPKQNSTNTRLNRSNYWIELNGGMTALGADLSAGIGYGTYSSRWLPEGEVKDAAALLLLTAGKTLNEDIAVFWSYSLDLFNSGFENIFLFGGSYSF